MIARRQGALAAIVAVLGQRLADRFQLPGRIAKFRPHTLQPATQVLLRTLPLFFNLGQPGSLFIQPRLSLDRPLLGFIGCALHLLDAVLHVSLRLRHIKLHGCVPFALLRQLATGGIQQAGRGIPLDAQLLDASLQFRLASMTLLLVVLLAFALFAKLVLGLAQPGSVAFGCRGQLFQAFGQYRLFARCLALHGREARLLRLRDPFVPAATARRPPRPGCASAPRRCVIAALRGCSLP